MSYLGNERRSNKRDEVNLGDLILEKISAVDRRVGHLEATLMTLRVEDLADLKVEIARLEIKSGVWGAVAGAIPVIVALLFGWLKRG